MESENLSILAYFTFGRAILASMPVFLDRRLFLSILEVTYCDLLDTLYSCLRLPLSLDCGKEVSLRGTVVGMPIVTKFLSFAVYKYISYDVIII